MDCFARASPALKEILLKLHRGEKLLHTDHQFIEYGSVQYHIQVLNPVHIYLSVATPLLSQEILQPSGVSKCILQKTYSNMVEVVDTPKPGYQLTIRIDFSKFPQNKEDCLGLITDISSLKADIVSSQLKEMLWFISFQSTSHAMFKPIKVVYDLKEHFFVIRQPEKISVVFPMRFRDDSDVIIATTLFQELMVLGCSRSSAKTPPCTWSPIPPLELRGERLEDLSTNGGFMSFDIFSRHVEGSRLDKTVWNLLNFHAYVKYYVKCTSGFIQRSMRKQLESLSEVLLNSMITRNETSGMKIKGSRCLKKVKRLSNTKFLRKKCSRFFKKMMLIRSKIKIHGLSQLHRRWLKLPQFYSLRRYKKLD